MWGFCTPLLRQRASIKGGCRAGRCVWRWTASTCVADRHQRRLKLPHLLREQLHIAARRQRHQLKSVAMLCYDVERLRSYRACRPRTMQSEGLAVGGQMYRSCMRLLTQGPHLWSPVWTASAGNETGVSSQCACTTCKPSTRRAHTFFPECAGLSCTGTLPGQAEGGPVPLLLHSVLLLGFCANESSVSKLFKQRTPR